MTLVIYCKYSKPFRCSIPSRFLKNNQSIKHKHEYNFESKVRPVLFMTSVLVVNVSDSHCELKWAELISLFFFYRIKADNHLLFSYCLKFGLHFLLLYHFDVIRYKFKVFITMNTFYFFILLLLCFQALLAILCSM